MRDPFKIQGPALISFSGGRTSAYMLRRILDAGKEPDVHVVFADTGREMPETYTFVDQCEQKWGVKVNRVHREGYFEKLIDDKKALPNVMMRFCTSELKLKPIWAWGRAAGWEHWTSVIGIRHDEPRRVAKIRGRPAMEFEDITLPLVDAGIVLKDVQDFWKGQPFDLQLHPWESNCDLCFLKGNEKRIRIMQDHPHLADWWIQQEKKTGHRFVKEGRPDYSTLLQRSRLPMLFDPNEGPEEFIDCVCGD